MEPVLWSSQNPATGPNPEPAESDPHFYTIFLKSTLILSPELQT